MSRPQQPGRPSTHASAQLETQPDRSSDAHHVGYQGGPTEAGLAEGRPEEFHVRVVQRRVDGVDPGRLQQIAKIQALGIISLGDVEEVGPGPLVEDVGLPAELAAQVVSIASEAAKRLAIETAAAKALAIEEAAAAAAAAATAAAEGEVESSEAAGTVPGKSICREMNLSSA